MSSWWQVRLVARRELRERSRSKGLWVGTAFMLVMVVAAIVVPALVDDDAVDRNVGLTAMVPDALAAAMVDHGAAVDVRVDVNRYSDRADGEEALRDGDIDVLVVDGDTLVWRGDPDQRLRAVLSGAIHLKVLQDRASEAGITPEQLEELAAPVLIGNEELGIAAGRNADDETAAYVMSILLLLALATYGQLVLTGVVQEKSSRVVEVLLARMSARTLLAGKVAGIGLLGLAQFVVTAITALIATVAIDSADIPAVSGDVLAWVVVWFVLGYAIYATAYGAFGSLAARTEDASSIAAPVTALLLVAYWAALIAVSSNPEGAWAQLASLFPATAPFAMPGRVALGTAAWWEPWTAVALALAAIAGLVAFAGRVYTGAILHTGTTIKLRDAWTRATETRARPSQMAEPSNATVTQAPTIVGGSATRRMIPTDSAAMVTPLVAVAVGVAVAVIFSDVIVGIAAGAALFAIVNRVIKARMQR
jgi:ABC-2 type transport system permease protein